MSQMRDEFEKAVCARILADHPDSGLTVDEIKATRQGDFYESSTWSGMWWAWQDSRSTLVIELPETPNRGVGYGLWDAGKESCREAIEAAGLRVKP